MLCGAYVVLCLVYGFDAQDTVKLAAATLVLLASLLGLWGDSRSLLLLHENGVVKRTFRGTTTLAFDDVTSLAIDRRSSKDSLHRDLISGKQDLRITLTLSDGTKTVEFGEGSFGADTQLEAIAERVTTIVAKKLISTLDRTGTLALIPNVEFSNGKIAGTLAPQVTQASVGVVPPPVQVDSKILLLDPEDLSVCVRLHRGWAYLQQGEMTLGVINSAAPNLFPVLEVLAQRTHWTVMNNTVDDATTRAVPPERFNTR